MFESVTATALNSALDGLTLRQKAIANNIANVNTPGYQARRVQFEDALKSAVASGSGVVEATTKLSLEPTKLNGNNVNMDTETLSSIDTVLRIQYATQAIDGQFKSMRAALKSN